jgi:HPt (histidine-containing phosphotransfer) domain-containing protein
MLTIEKLRNFGADVDEALVRCMNKEDFYLSLVNRATEDKKLFDLEIQINDKDYDAAFETAHTLKGLFSNLALTPVAAPVCEITELLRSKAETDYSALMAEAKKQFDKLRTM